MKMSLLVNDDVGFMFDDIFLVNSKSVQRTKHVGALVVLLWLRVRAPRGLHARCSNYVVVLTDVLASPWDDLVPIFSTATVQ